jgi:uncharacterized membrane protein
MKRIKTLVAYKSFRIIFVVLMIALNLGCIKFAFFLLNQPSIITFVIGWMVLIASFAFPGEYLIRKFKNRK